jgi:putative SOS response-associated peptidase YedK
MCNLYSIRRPRDEVIGLFGISQVDDGVQLELPASYPDTMAPIIKLDDNGARNLTMMRWGFPHRPRAVRGR